MISTVIPLYNKEAHIKQTLDSAEKSLKLADVEYEIIIINDGSTDNSQQEVEGWIKSSSKRNKRTKLITTENKGVSEARNLGWNTAQYELIAFLDADDEWTEVHIYEILSLVKNYPNAVLYATAWAEITADGHFKEITFGIGAEKEGILPCFFTAMATGPMLISSSTAVARKSQIKRTGGFPRNLTHGEDKVTWGNLALLGDVAFSPVIGGIWNKMAENRSDLIINEHSQFAFLKHCVEPAILSKRTPELLLTGLKKCWLSEKARSLGLINIYEHDTPEKIRDLLVNYVNISKGFI